MAIVSLCRRAGEMRVQAQAQLLAKLPEIQREMMTDIEDYVAKKKKRKESYGSETSNLSNEV